MRRFNLKGAGLALACGSLMFLVSGSGWADNPATSTAPVDGIVYNLCTITSTGATTFNFLPLTLTAQHFTGPVLNVICTVGATAVISIEDGANDTSHTGSLVTAAHYATDGNGNYLAYNTTKDLNGTQPWGTNLSGNTVTENGSGSVQHETIYLTVPTGQNALPGSDSGITYSDTLDISVAY